MTRRARPGECSRCTQVRSIGRSLPGGAVCPSCYRRALATVGQCALCAQRRVLPDHTGDGDGVCAPCAGIDEFGCATCGAGDQAMLNTRICVQCDTRRRLLDALCPDGEPDRPAETLIDVLVSHNPRLVRQWLSTKPERIALLQAIATGAKPLTHATLDELAAVENVEHLRKLLIAGGLLPVIDHDLAAFDRWTTSFLAGIDSDTDRSTLATYISWHHRRRLVRMISLGTLRPFSTRGARLQTRVAARFLDWLTSRGSTLERCQQSDIDEWFAAGPTTRRQSLSFLVWARDSRLCNRQLRFPNFKPATPTGMPRTNRVALIRRLLTDDAVRLGDRVAGLLVAVYAQPVSRLCHIRVEDIDLAAEPSSVLIHGTLLELDSDTAGLVQRLIDNHHGDGRTEWLFPGKHPSRPVAAKTLIERLNRIGVTRDARVAAFHDLAVQIPSPVLAALIGYNPNFLAERATALGVPWQTYPTLRPPS